ncbi:WHG domain-containing protein [Myxococcus sp. K15C18031901]|nr:WHG domain-containing protein [Myxococcus dinghuensis]
MEEALARTRAPDLAGRVRALGRCYVSFAVEHPAHYRVMFREEWGDEEKYAAVHEEGMRAFQRLLELTAEASAASGGKVDMETLAFNIWAWVHGLASLWNEGPLRKKTGSDSISPLLERSLDLLVMLIVGS